MNTKSNFNGAEHQEAGSQQCAEVACSMAAPLFAERLLFTIKESALLLNICEKSVYRLIQRGKLRCISCLRHKRIPKEELQRFLKDELT